MIEALSSWKPQEKWVWEQLSQGKPAVFPVQAVKLENSQDKRLSNRLSSDFIEQILFEKPYKNAIPRQGVRIVRANIEQTLDLSYGEIPHLIMFVGCEFSQETFLLGFQTSKDLSFENSHFLDGLDMEGAKIGGLLTLRGGTFKNVMLRGGVVSRELNLVESRVHNALVLDGITVNGPLNADGAHSSDVNLNHSKLGKLNMLSTTVTGSLKLENCTIETGVHLGGPVGASPTVSQVKDYQKEGNQRPTSMDIDQIIELGWPIVIPSKSKFGDVSLGSSTIGSNCTLTGAVVSGELNMDSVKIGGNLYLRYGEYSDINLQLAIVGSIMDIRGAKFHGAFDVRRLSVRAFVDFGNEWPKNIDIEGMTYTQLPPHAIHRPVKWFKGWLAKLRSFSHQPYEQLANILRQSGYRDKADAVLYAKETVEWKRANFRRRIWLTTLWAFIGFGFKTHRALLWIIVLTGIGVILLGQQSVHGLGDHTLDRIFYSFDVLLPVVTLDNAHEAVQLSGWTKIYFYGLKIMGFVLASFLIAGLSGLTKK